MQILLKRCKHIVTCIIVNIVRKNSRQWGTLTRHQNTAKSCLIKRNTPGKLYCCQYCNQDFTQTFNLKRHTQSCFVRFELENEKTIKSLEEKYLERIDLLNKENKAIRDKFKAKNKNLKRLIEEKDEKFKKLIEEKDEEIVSLKIACGSSKADSKV